MLKAVCIATNTKVIVKAYYKSKMHPKHYHKLQREIEAMKSLNGPYVAEFYARFEDSQCVYIIMEFCEGGDLFKTMLMHGGLLDEQWVCVEVSLQGKQRQGRLQQELLVEARRCGKPPWHSAQPTAAQWRRRRAAGICPGPLASCSKWSAQKGLPAARACHVAPLLIFQAHITAGLIVAHAQLACSMHCQHMYDICVVLRRSSHPCCASWRRCTA